MGGKYFARLCQIALTSFVLVAATPGDFTTECPSECRCRWTSGYKGADCSGGNFQDVPKKLSSEIQILELSGNPMFEITWQAFENVGLKNLKKLVLKDCQLLIIHRNGLSGLRIMTELDLSKNNIKVLHPDTFKETEKITRIFLNNNAIEKLDDGLFRNLVFLQKVELSNNRIMSLGVKTFMNLPKLSAITLDGNQLIRLKVETLNSLPSLASLELNNNPWRCDCNLQPFRNWVISKRLSSDQIACAEPAKVHDKLWNDLDSSDFACKPTIIYPYPGALVASTNTNVTLSCKVSGNPLPDVNWVMNSQIIDASVRYPGEPKYYLKESSSELIKWMNITILDAGASDNGEYLCVAKNPGGVEERAVKLVIESGPGIVTSSGIDNNMLPVLIGVSCGIAILLIILVFLCYCCCRRRDSEKKKADTSNGEALIEGSVIPEMEKSLITAVNPVTKPPRRYEAPSVTSGGTEMSELNKTLLDNDSVFAHNEVDFEHQQKRLPDTLSIDYTRLDSRTYPPDLLPFPPRATQISPAASNASTVPDTTRLPNQLNPISPIHSSMYGVNHNAFRTLPYSRSQSPFTSPITPPVITQRQGYVTIPRRPRVPSWSSTASTQILPSSEAQEPLYDNLGLRTTADGSSVLSLNKSGLEQQFSPMRGRPLPATPTVYPNPHPMYYAPIEEQEPAPSPVPGYATNPRNSVSSHHQLSTPGPQEPINPRISWAAKNTSTPNAEPRKVLFSNSDIPNRSSTDSQTLDASTLGRKVNKPETGSLRRNPPAVENKKNNAKLSSKTDEKNNSADNNVSLNQSNGTIGRSGKIPPRPPPKPKKKPSADSSQPLFEDECEDGTEV